MKDLQSLLFTIQDLKYKNFTEKLIPDITKESIIGVRVPELRKLAKEILKTDNISDFLLELPHKYFEENNIHAFILQSINDFDIAIYELEKFLPYLNNWATCDSFVPKAFIKNTDILFPYVEKWIKSSHVYTIRYAVCLLMKLYLDYNFDVYHLKIVSDIKSDEYYVNMVRAWYFATALAKQYNYAICYIENNKLDLWTHNKTIQKALESCRIDDETKKYLRSLKINKKYNKDNNYYINITAK